ncbi:MAG: amidase [Sporolactobacillus sp.]
MQNDIYHAFSRDGLNIPPDGKGTLDGLTFAAKDVFAVRGHINSAGNPTWQRTHQPATQHAPVVQRLLASGATLRGMTVTDELMYSLKGDNQHYPPTINPRLPDAYSGGSSSGSAVSVAAELTDFALGTDTGGSVRIPASYCGLFGIRPTHGAIPLDGVIPLAPSFDTVGWMARSAAILEKVGNCLLPPSPVHSYTNCYVLEEAWQLAACEQEKQALLRFAGQLLNGIPLERLSLPFIKPFELAEVFRIIQGVEAWQSHGQWIMDNQPDFGHDIAGRFTAAAQMTRDARFNQATESKEQLAKKMDECLDPETLLIVPTTYGPAPKRSASSEQAERVRAHTMQLTCIAGVSGLPQVTIPLVVNGQPLGLSFISSRHSDRQLLEFVSKLF